MFDRVVNTLLGNKWFKFAPTSLNEVNFWVQLICPKFVILDMYYDPLLKAVLEMNSLNLLNDIPAKI